MQRHVYKVATNDGNEIEKSPLLGAHIRSTYIPTSSSTSTSTLTTSRSKWPLISIRALLCLAAALFILSLIKRFTLSTSTSTSSSSSRASPQLNSASLFPSSLDPTILVNADIAHLLLESDTNSTYIPDIVHYIIGVTHSSRDGQQQSKPEFSLLNYLSIKSAADVLQANEIYCHVVNEPEGEWWMKAKTRCTRILKTRSIDAIYGRLVTHQQHKITLLRLETLLQYGGISCELDVLFLRSIKSNPQQYQLYFQLPLLLSHAMSSSIKWYDRFDTSIVASRASHPFIREWLTSYKHFVESSHDQLANEANHQVVIRTHEVNRFSNKMVWDLHTLRPQYAYTLPTKEMPGWGQPYAAEAAGQTMLYDQQAVQTFIELETQFAVHCWQGEHEMIVEELDETGRTKSVTSRYSGNLYDKFLLKNIQDVCLKAETTNYGRFARLAMLSTRPGTTPSHTC